MSQWISSLGSTPSSPAEKRKKRKEKSAVPSGLSLLHSNLLSNSAILKRRECGHQYGRGCLLGRVNYRGKLKEQRRLHCICIHFNDNELFCRPVGGTVEQVHASFLGHAQKFCSFDKCAKFGTDPSMVRGSSGVFSPM